MLERYRHAKPYGEESVPLTLPFDLFRSILGPKRLLGFGLASGLLSALLLPGALQAQGTSPEAPNVAEPAAGLGTLRFINPRARVTLPEPMPGPVLRFVVADDFPPFAFIDGEGRLAGAHIDLIRSVCATLDLPCTLQARRFEQVLSAVDEDPNNLVLVAGLAITPQNARLLTFSLPYYRFAGRFISLRAAQPAPDGEAREQGVPEPPSDWIAGARIGVVDNTAHGAFLAEAYGDTNVERFTSADLMYQALRRGDVSHAFGDGVDFAFWLAGSQSGDCCTFVGQPLFSRTFFGEGLAFAVPHGQSTLVQALNAALARLEGSGELEAILLTAFPLDPLAQ